MPFSKEQTVSEIVKQNPITSKIFFKHNVDFCCGGKMPLEKSCEKHNVELSAILNELNDSIIESNDENLNFNTASEVIDHILVAYHKPLYETLAILKQLSTKVSQVHGDSQPELIELNGHVHFLVEDLKQHMIKEEDILFPMIKDLENNENAKNAFLVDGPINQMEFEHENVAEILQRMKTITNDYVPPRFACNSYRGLFALLKEFEFELYKHIFLENNILHPMAKKTQSTMSLN